MSNVVKLASVFADEEDHQPRKPQPIERIIGEALRAERLKSGISLEGLGDITSISGQQWQKHFKGTNRLTVSRLLEAASVMGFNPGGFVNDLYDSTLDNGAMSARAEAAKHLSTPGALEVLGRFNAMTPERRRIVLRLMRELAGDDGKA